VDGQVLPACLYTLEDKVREIDRMPVASWKIPHETAIPVGTYEVIIDMSTRFKKLMIHLLNVPGFDGIRAHAGNTSHDTDGCLVVGKFCNEVEGIVWGSRDARDALQAEIGKALERGERVFWTVEGLPGGGKNHG